MFFKINLTKDKLLKILNIILVAFLVIQPIFDLKIFYNSISTLIRVIVIGILFLFYFFLDKKKKKYLLLYPLVLAIYILFHHINANKFTSLVPGNFNYSFTKELLYFIKMITPFLLIYCLYNSYLKKQELIKIIKIIVLIIGLIIIISNLFVFSYSSYNDQIIKANFFSWFNNSQNYTYQELSSKGLFEYANQISAILLMFLPFCLNSFLENKKKFDFGVLIINIFALFLLGTKVAVFGIFLVFVYTLVVYLFDKKILKKQKINNKSLSFTLISILIYSLILPINPSFMRIDETKTIAASSESIISEANSQEINPTIIEKVYENVNESEISSLNLVDYIEQNYESKEIKKEFITQSYPYNYDPEFWFNIFNEDRINRVNYRFIEQSMIERVLEINNNKFDILFGITNTRVQNIFNIERDFVVQYYALGIIGLIIIFVPYIILLAVYLYKTFKSKFKSINTINAISFVTIIFLYGISYYTGNLLNSLSFTIYFSILFIFLLK